MKRCSATLLALASISIVACSEPSIPTTPLAPSAPSEIVNGTYTGSSFASVGGLLFDYDENGVIDGNDLFCTGTLISPTVFLTAAHCVVSSDTPPGSQWYVSFAPDLYARGLKVIKADAYYSDPLYGHDQANLHDLAVIILPANSTKGLTPYSLPRRGELDQLSAKGALNDAIFYNVGYGTSATRTGIPDFSFDGRRYVSESKFMGLQQYWLGLLMNSSATGLGGDCYGDSGGPKFLKSTPGIVYATVTTGDYNCRATTWDYRTDTDDARAFLGRFVSLP
jgi:V8-like Glu-specific endopeptidase